MPIKIDKLYAYKRNDGSVHYQAHAYQDGGWSIVEKDGVFTVYETPEMGGKEFMIRECTTFVDAIETTHELP